MDAACTKPCSRAARPSPARRCTTWTRSTTAARSWRNGRCRFAPTTRPTRSPPACSRWSIACCPPRCWRWRDSACRSGRCGSLSSGRLSLLEMTLRSTSNRWAVAAALLAALPAYRLSAQSDVDRLAVRLASMTAVTGLEQAMTDSLLALLPGSTRDRAGNVTVTLGQGSPKRLLQCPLDEVGYVVGNVTGEGYVLLRRVGARTTYPLFDQQLEGHRVTVFGTRGPVPGVVAMKSTHLTRGRVAASAPDPVFTVDNAYVDVGAASAAETRALGVDVLAPASLTKRPLPCDDRLLAAPGAGRRAACASLVAAVQAKPRVKGTVVA